MSALAKKFPHARPTSFYIVTEQLGARSVPKKMLADKKQRMWSGRAFLDSYQQFFLNCYGQRNVDILHLRKPEATVNEKAPFKYTKTVKRKRSLYSSWKMMAFVLWDIVSVILVQRPSVNNYSWRILWSAHLTVPQRTSSQRRLKQEKDSRFSLDTFWPTSI